MFVCFSHFILFYICVLHTKSACLLGIVTWCDPLVAALSPILLTVCMERRHPMGIPAVIVGKIRRLSPCVALKENKFSAGEWWWALKWVIDEPVLSVRLDNRLLCTPQGFHSTLPRLWNEIKGLCAAEIHSFINNLLSPLCTGGRTSPPLTLQHKIQQQIH